MADGGAISGAVIAGFRDEEALVAADAAYGAEVEDSEEPIPEGTVGVVEGFGVAGGAGSSVAGHEAFFGCDLP
jgi:hypothetical protein